MATDIEQQQPGEVERTNESTVVGETTRRRLFGGVAGGLVAGVVMGLLMGDGIATVGGLIGSPTVAAGWAFHLAISVSLALVFVGLLATDAIGRYTGSVVGSTAAGAIYGGIVLTVLTGGIAMPIWANAALDAGLAVPTITVSGFVNHLVYGVVLGGVYGALRTTAIRPETETIERSA